MISVQQAKELIAANTPLLAPVILPLNQSLRLVLAEEITAAYNIPAFPQSSMDGYAFRFNDWQIGEPLFVKDEMAAGSSTNISLQPKQAVRIFTGAAMPAGADTVVMQEQVSLQGDQLVINNHELAIGSNVRPVGSEINAGATALPKGLKLSPSTIGFLAGIGVNEVKVYPSPKINIVITGNELQQPGTPLTYGQVYESNSFALRAALTQLGIQNLEVSFVVDDKAILLQILQNALSSCDMLLVTGGVSVGDYDFVAETLQQCGVQKVFHKVKQKPGKPLYFGTNGNQLVFGLPGNPSSTLTCFYQYVLPAAEKMMGKEQYPSIQKRSLALTNDYTKKAALTHFLKGMYKGDKVTALTAQESYKMNSYAVANCLVCLEEEGMVYKKGDVVEVHILPSY